MKKTKMVIVKAMIKQQAEEIGLDYYHLIPSQQLMLLDMVYNKLDPNDPGRLSKASVIIHLRSVVLDNSRVRQIIQGFMEIYQWKNLAKSLRSVKLIHGRIRMESLFEVYERTYRVRDQYSTYSLLCELTRIGMITGTRTQNQEVLFTVCSSFKKIIDYLADQ